MVVRYHQNQWLVDRHGYRTGSVCTAYAASLGQAQNGNNPANPDLRWHVWESGNFVFDDRVYSIYGPDEVQLVGRELGRENFVCAGKYFLSGAAFGRAMYKHETDDFVIWYNKKDNRWSISDRAMVGTDRVAAWAQCLEIPASHHPADPSLQWNFWEPSRGEHAHDPLVGVLKGPYTTATIFCSSPQSQSAGIDGIYQLYGVLNGKPVFRHPNSGAIIRYSVANDQWQIDVTGGARPNFWNKCVAYIVQGTTETAENACMAWANAQGMDHPGALDLKWHLWDDIGQRHRPDSSIACTAAPEAFQVTKDAAGENSDIVGIYKLVCYQDHLGPEYCLQDAAAPMFMFFHAETRKWIIARYRHSGRHAAEAAVAYTDAYDNLDVPTRQKSWRVFQAASRNFVEDPTMSVVAITLAADLSSPAALQALPDDVQLQMLQGGPPIQQPACGVKRDLFMEPEFIPHLQGPEVKRVRRENQGLLSKLFGA
jgi:hypothetical protein